MVAVLASLSSFKCKVYMSSFFCIRPGAGRSRARKRGQGGLNDAVGLAHTAVEAVRVSDCQLSLATILSISGVHPGTENLLMAESINVAMHSMGSRCLSSIDTCSTICLYASTAVSKVVKKEQLSSGQTVCKKKMEETTMYMHET